MPRLTTKMIIEAVSAKTGVKSEYISLVRDCYGYYWGDKAGSVFKESGTNIQKLSDYTCERWIDDFEMRMNETLLFNSYKTLNEYIESIDWYDV